MQQTHIRMYGQTSSIDLRGFAAGKNLRRTGRKVSIEVEPISPRLKLRMSRAKNTPISLNVSRLFLKLTETDLSDYQISPKQIRSNRLLRRVGLKTVSIKFNRKKSIEGLTKSKM